MNVIFAITLLAGSKTNRNVKNNTQGIICLCELFDKLDYSYVHRKDQKAIHLCTMHNQFSSIF